MQIAQVILDSYHLLDHILRFRGQRLPEELQRVAQPFAVNAQGMKRLYRRALDHRLVATHDLVAVVDQGRHQVADPMGQRLIGEHWQSACPLSEHELAKITDESLISLAIQVLQHLIPLRLPLLLPVGQQWIEAGLLFLRQRVPVSLGLLHEDIQVAHAAQRAASASQSLEEGPEGVGIEIGAKDAEGGAHAAGGDAHVVQLFNVLPQPRARLVRQHPLKVEAQHLASGLAHGVVRQNTRGLQRLLRLHPDHGLPLDQEAQLDVEEVMP